jgi:transposase
MRGRLQMSERERRRLGPLLRVIGGEITLAAAALQMQISYRQARRVLERYRQEGDAGLVHRACGRASPRRKDPAFRECVLELVRTKYADFGPTHASEKLAERDGKAVNRETLRRWLIESGERQPRQTKQVHRTWRARKACFGEMVQLDGSPHAWFADRGPGCFLMNLVDDATAEAQALFSGEETTWAAMDVLEGWVRRYGIPVSIYVDRKNVYVTHREQTPEEQLVAMPALTQFGRACHKLGIRIIEAHSPQAKGRVERKHGVFQDRLIKDMRLEGISDIEAGNVYLPAWLKKNNAQFAKAARSDLDMHRPLPDGLDLGTVFCLEEERSLGMDYTVRYKNQWLQVTAQKELPAPRSRVAVQERRDGSLHLSYKGRELNCRLLNERPQTRRCAVPEERAQKVPATVPAEDHPWRRPRRSADYIDPRQLPELVNQLADTYLGTPDLGS